MASNRNPPKEGLSFGTTFAPPAKAGCVVGPERSRGFPCAEKHFRTNDGKLTGLSCRMRLFVQVWAYSESTHAHPVTERLRLLQTKFGYKAATRLSPKVPPRKRSLWIRIRALTST